MDESPVIRIWVTNKNNRAVTSEMNESLIEFLTSAADNGCNGFTFAEDAERLIVFTVWSSEQRLEEFRTTDVYKNREKEIIRNFTLADYQLNEDILFNSTAKIIDSFSK